jgi:hypothetical protein
VGDPGLCSAPTQVSSSSASSADYPRACSQAPLTQAPPANIGDIIKLTGSPTNEVQSLAAIGSVSGWPSTTTTTRHVRGFNGWPSRASHTANIAYNASSSASRPCRPRSRRSRRSATRATSYCAGSGALARIRVSPVPTITFQGQLAGSNMPMITVVSTALTGGSTPAVAVTETTPGTGLYDPVGSWFDLGATKNGVNPTMNNTEEEFTIDQQKVSIGVLPNEFTWAFATSLVEVTPENLAFVWDMGPVTLNTLPAVPEKVVGFGTTDGYTVRRIAIVHRRPATQGGLLRAHFFRKMIRQAAETSLGYASTGDQQTVALQMRGLVDDNVTDPFQNVGYLLDQTA